MPKDRKVAKDLCAAAVCIATLGAGASVEAARADELTYSFNIGATSNYVFRGVSQNEEDPALQGGVDLGYGIAYVGAWSSMADFGLNADGSRLLTTELDWYAGLRPTWGSATFDFAALYYTYPGANDNAPARYPEQDYLELKAGVSGAFLPSLPKLTLTAAVYYSPEYGGEQGQVWTPEGTAAYELPKFGVFTPIVSGTLGGQFGDADKNGNLSGFIIANGEDSLAYWNLGLALVVEKLTFDFRYWDSNIKNNNLAGGGLDNWCTGPALQCGEQFSFSVKVVVP